MNTDHLIDSNTSSPSSSASPVANTDGDTQLMANATPIVSSPEERSGSLLYLADYQPPDYAIDTVDLTFELDPTATIVTNRMRLRQLRDEPLVLDGSQLLLKSLRLNGEAITSAATTEHTLILKDLPSEFELEIVTQTNPYANKSLEGLYLSNGRFCTQCEAAGFRHITYYLDRPDVMAVFSTTVKAPKTYPILLSNGNPVAHGEEGDSHWVRWDDPFKKPCYLFALVAGDLALKKDTFTTRSGREIALEIYVEPQDADKTEHAMRSLKASMQWDEERFGREYDLDIYMIVAVNDFNMGAMENKGLNVFNAKYVLASADTATDDDYDGIESVIGHEYFHNWTGNRITCRDWFQLSLKEGLTVYRDQEFSADLNSRALQRIGDVKRLREFQFPEDAGPTAHPIRPDQYGSVNNMYTATVYEKGAEVIRMQATLLGREGFRRGMDVYFDRHDGQAVTCEDFTQCMQDANDVDWTQFLRWYSQAGTPVVQATDSYDEARGQYKLHFQQHTPDTAGQHAKPPLLIPIDMALYDDHGQPLVASQVLEFSERQQTFTFEVPVGLTTKPIPSLLRGFSAPVKLHFDYSVQQLLVLLQHDDDALAVWDAAQRLMTQAVLALSGIEAAGAKTCTPKLDHTALISALDRLLNDVTDPALTAELLALPSMNSLSEGVPDLPIDQLHDARLAWQKALSDALYPTWQAIYTRYADEDNAPARRLKNVALECLCAGANPEGLRLAAAQQQQASNMTDEFGALKPQVWNQHDGRDIALNQFADKWIKQPLVMDKWLMLQATSPTENVLAQVQALIDHPAFDRDNPNRIRSLIGAFARMNDVNFHQVDGAGYRFVADWVITLDPTNPQVASALVAAFNRWRRCGETRRNMMQAELERIRSNVKSSNVLDIVSRALSEN